MVAGARGQRGITDNLTITFESGSLRIQSLDSGLVRLGQQSGPFPDPASSEPDMVQGAHFVLHANSWSTNFAYWFSKHAIELFLQLFLMYLPSSSFLFLLVS